jgi:ketosteroid isomerase-like protein
MPRFFNTTGPCRPERHYMLPPEARLPELAELVEREQYFVLHAPRQTGKTTTILAFARSLQARGVAALMVSFEECLSPSVALAEDIWMHAISEEARWELPVAHRPPDPGATSLGAPGTRFSAWLRAWCAGLDVPVVLFIDEADAVRGEALVSLLRQLRRGFAYRGVGRFPVSIALVGLRDLRDYIADAKDGQAVSLGSPFNVTAGSFTLADFTADEVRTLLLQHTAETGQPWSEAALARVFDRTQGQPFLVNALADIAVTHLAPDRSAAIEVEAIDQAVVRLILSRRTHLANLAERLKEPRVARVVQSVLLGDEALEINAGSDDFAYTQDLGLVRRGPQGAEVANPIYREVLVRELTVNEELSLPAPWWPWRTPQGRLDVPALVAAFLRWWRENADILRDTARSPYHEAAAHLAFMGFLQRVVNGGGTVEREYAAARGRVDVVVSYAGERHVFELKRVSARHGLQRVVDEGITQLAGYLDTLGVDEGWLIVFDPRPERTWEERLWEREETRGGRRVRVRGG